MKISNRDITLSKTFQGAYRCSTIMNDEYFTFQYMGYTKKESIEAFKQYVNEEIEGRI